MSRTPIIDAADAEDWDAIMAQAETVPDQDFGDGVWLGGVILFEVAAVAGVVGFVIGLFVGLRA